MLNGVDAAKQRRADGTVAVGVRHDGKPCVVRHGDHGADLAFGQRPPGDDAVVVKVHQAGDHELDKMGSLGFRFGHKRAVFVRRVKAAADEAAVVPGFVDREGGHTVADAVFRREPGGKRAHAPAVAAVAQIGIAAQLILPERFAHGLLLHAVLMAGDGVLPPDPVKDHMNMTVNHGSPLPARSADRWRWPRRPRRSWR